MSSPLRPLVLSLALAVQIAACNREPEPPLQNQVAMTITDKGYEPQNLRVRKDQPVTLVITRTSDATCGTEIVIDEYGIKTPLPLGEAVTVRFTPTKSGELKYGCAMQKMVGGVIRVE